MRRFRRTRRRVSHIAIAEALGGKAVDRMEQVPDEDYRGSN